MVVCEIQDCERETNRDGLCFGHKLKTVGFSGLHRFRNDREMGLTQEQRKQEIYEGARRTGDDITRAR